jgi:hypothetical protein
MKPEIINSVCKMNYQGLMSSTKNINKITPSDKLHILNVLNKAPCHDSTWGRRGEAPHILKLNTTRWWSASSQQHQCRDGRQGWFG